MLGSVLEVNHVAYMSLARNRILGFSGIDLRRVLKGRKRFLAINGAGMLVVLAILFGSLNVSVRLNGAASELSASGQSRRVLLLKNLDAGLLVYDHCGAKYELLRRSDYESIRLLNDRDFKC